MNTMFQYSRHQLQLPILRETLVYSGLSSRHVGACQFHVLVNILVPAPRPFYILSRRRREMYIGHARLRICLSLAACRHYYTDPDVT